MGQIDDQETRFHPLNGTNSSWIRHYSNRSYQCFRRLRVAPVKSLERCCSAGQRLDIADPSPVELHSPLISH
jgi:hypothetical protein